MVVLPLTALGIILTGSDHGDEDCNKVNSDPTPLYFPHNLGWYNPVIYYTKGCQTEYPFGDAGIGMH